ncbi:MAG: helix-hairpin-helix domain-containing protein [Candidatus Kapaibacterium sp.]|jgi:competence protein ComEA|nr:helix-hairpin-helix domain-containing protein [Candidatus Kapabacteria bacterium]
MKIPEIIAKIKTITGTSKSELTVVTVLLIGLLIGSSVRYFDKDNRYKDRVNPEVFRLLDSLAEEAARTYTGTDISNNPFIDTNEATQSNVLKLNTQPNPSTVKKYSKAERLVNVKIDLNNASKLELMKLPNIGEKTAVAILNFRKEHRFEKPSDIMKIKGIGVKKFESMKEFIEVK